MEKFGDQDGKAKTASAVDETHYPEVTQKDHETPPAPAQPTEAEIAARAYQLWLERGCQAGSHEQNWLEAERELQSAAISQRLTQMGHEKGGSVQN